MMPTNPLRHHDARDYWYFVDPTTHKQVYLSRDKNTAARKWREIQGGKPILPSGAPTTISEATTRWLATHGGNWERYQLVDWARVSMKIALADVDHDLLKRYATHCKRKKWSAETIRKRVRLAHVVLRWCHEQGWIATLPTKPRLDQPIRRPRDYKLDAIDAAWRTLGQAKDVLSFILEIGCRPGEACRLLWVHVDLDQDVCILDAHKTGKKTGRPRTLYLTAHAKELITRQPHLSSHVFLNGRKRPYTSSGLRQILKRRGLPGAYGLRHTRAQHMLDDGVAMEDVAAWLGHRDLTTVQTYAQVRDDRLRNLATKLKPMAG